MSDVDATPKSFGRKLLFALGLETTVADFEKDWVRNHAIEIAVVAAGLISGVARIEEMATFQLLILVADCMALWSFYVISFNVIVQVCATGLAAIKGCDL